MIETIILPAYPLLDYTARLLDHVLEGLLPNVLFGCNAMQTQNKMPALGVRQCPDQNSADTKETFSRSTATQ